MGVITPATIGDVKRLSQSWGGGLSERHCGQRRWVGETERRVAFSWEDCKDRDKDGEWKKASEEDSCFLTLPSVRERVVGGRAPSVGVGPVFRGRRSVWPFRAGGRRPASPPRLFRLS